MGIRAASPENETQNQIDSKPGSDQPENFKPEPIFDMLLTVIYSIPPKYFLTIYLYDMKYAWFLKKYAIKSQILRELNFPYNSHYVELLAISSLWFFLIFNDLNPFNWIQIIELRKMDYKITSNYI